MNETLATVEKRIRLSAERTDRLNRLARISGVGEDQIVERALDIFFSLAELFDEQAERRDWSLLSEESLQRIWDNETDAAYDNWRDLYDLPAR